MPPQRLAFSCEIVFLSASSPASFRAERAARSRGIPAFSDARAAGTSPKQRNSFLCGYLVVAALLFCQSSTEAQVVKVAAPEFQTPVSIRLANPGKDGKTFQTIEITEGNHHFRVRPRHPVSCIPENKDEQLQRGLFPTHVPGMPLDPSRCFFHGEYGSSPKHTLLAFVGEPGIGAAPLYVLGFKADGTPLQVLQSEALDLVALQLDAADSARIIGRRTLSESMFGDALAVREHKPYATTYGPVSAYIVHAGSKATYSLQASREYNQRHYVWAGPRVREDYAVVYNLPRHAKPFGVPAKQLDAVMAKVSTAHKQ